MAKLKAGADWESMRRDLTNAVGNGFLLFLRRTAQGPETAISLVSTDAEWGLMSCWPLRLLAQSISSAPIREIGDNCGSCQVRTPRTPKLRQAGNLKNTTGKPLYTRISHQSLIRTKCVWTSRALSHSSSSRIQHCQLRIFTVSKTLAHKSLFPWIMPTRQVYTNY